MKISCYELTRVRPDEWSFDSTELRKVNLLVGDSGTGKTRFLNTIVNFAKQATDDKLKFTGNWKVDFDIAGSSYIWKITVAGKDADNPDAFVESERLFRADDAANPILCRDEDGSFFQGEKLPRLSSQISSLTLFQEEDEIRDIRRGFRSIVARRFSGDALNENFSHFRSVAPDTVKRLLASGDLLELQEADVGYHYKMHILSKSHPELYGEVLKLYKEAFPYVTDFSFRDFQDVMSGSSFPFKAPVLVMKERHVNNWIPVTDVSSGMKKLFLLILDTYLLQDGGLLIVDEYENSLGVNAINFLPELLHNIDSDCQFIITSHHPYIINSIPMENWRVFHRKGLDVRIKAGEDLKLRYEKSSQDRFVQLINDPFFTEGVE